MEPKQSISCVLVVQSENINLS